MSVALSIGIPNFGSWSGGDWGALLEVARSAEDTGFDRLVVSDHVLLGPRLDAYSWGRFPTEPDGPWLEPLTCLTAMAAVTTRIRLATGILIAALRPAPLLAKTVATLDAISGGRVDLGVGVGWQREEYVALGLDFTARGRMLDDTIAACRALWTAMPAAYESQTTTFSDVWCVPQPAQPRLPVWFSGTLNDRNLRRVVELGDGWIPIMGATVDDIRDGAQRLRDATDRPLDIQSPLPLVRGGDGAVDLPASAAGLPDLAAAGVTNVYVNVASLARAPADAPAALERAATVLRSAS
jgi:probable F420-dependent oxidoreductase